MKLENIKKGDTFWECANGYNDLYVALEDARLVREDDNYWELNAKALNGKLISFATSNGCSGHIYSYPEYVCRNIKTREILLSEGLYTTIKEVNDWALDNMKIQWMGAGKLFLSKEK